MNQVTLPVVVIIIITRKWNSKSKIKALEKMRPQNVIEWSPGETHQTPSASSGDAKSEKQVAAVGRILVLHWGR